MDNSIILLLLLVGLLNVGLGLFAIARNARSLSNISFAITSFALGGWVLGIAGFLSVETPAAALAWSKVYYFFPQVVATAILVFAYLFMRDSKPNFKLLLILIPAFLLVVLPIIFFPHYLTTDILYHDWGKEVTLNKPAYLLYSAYLLLCLGGAELIMLIKSRKLTGIYRAQAAFFFYGFLATGVFGVLFNLILPWFGNYRLIWLGPLFTTCFVVSIFYSIIRHKMFDIRLAVVRSVGYLLTFGLIIILYSTIVFGLGSVILNESTSLSHFQQGFYITMAVLIALAFQPVKHFFDRLTSQIFYRDAYDSQNFIDRLTNILVTNTELPKLLRESSDLIAANLKPSYTRFILLDSHRDIRFIGQMNHSMNEDEANDLLEFAGSMPEKIINSDDMRRQDHRSLRKLLQRRNIALVVKLTSHGELMGVILVGAKRSGNMYNSKDVGVFEIIADELSLAIENSLHYEEIASFNETLRTKVEDATRELRRTNEKLKALDEAKDEFISMASHQLRTPLTSVKGYVSMVLDGDAGELNEQQKKLLQQSFISSQRMVYLIADLLNVSRLRTGKFIIETAPTCLPLIVEEEVDQLQETASARGLKIFYDRPAKFPKLELDETKIRQVIMNFLDNAIYYTPAGGKITVTLNATSTSAELRIVDTGLGVPKGERHKLFDKFYRASNAKRARPDGTGLGLFMAKKVIVAQGGAIIFTSEEGKGSTFGFSFPLSKLAVADKPAEKPTEK